MVEDEKLHMHHKIHVVNDSSQHAHGLLGHQRSTRHELHYSDWH